MLTEQDTPKAPAGRNEVMSALIQATISLLIEKGTNLSVREIAANAGVNHGLVHTYFQNKDALIDAAFDEINARAAAELDDQGFPPPDLAQRRSGELAKALAWVMLQDKREPSDTHPVMSSWVDALSGQSDDTGTKYDKDEIEERVVIASSIALGWALFGDHLLRSRGLDESSGVLIGTRIAGLIAQIGGIPTSTNEPSKDTRSSAD